MKRKNKLDSAAEQLLDILERHAADLPAQERDAKWSALHKVASKAGTSSKSRDKPRTLRTLRSTRKQA
jgi:hypothetical protein